VLKYIKNPLNLLNMENLEQEIDKIVGISDNSTSMHYTGSLSNDEQNAIKDRVESLVAQMEPSDLDQLPIIYRKRVIGNAITTAVTIGIGTMVGALIDADQGSQIVAPIGAYVGALMGVKQIPRLMDYRNLIAGLRDQYNATKV
jgi:hypothetical protein